MLEVLYYHAKFGGVWISLAAGVAENVEFFLSVCLSVSVRHAFERQSYAPDFAMKPFEYKNDSDAVG